jgi:hypothetical protein
MPNLSVQSLSIAISTIDLIDSNSYCMSGNEVSRLSIIASTIAFNNVGSKEPSLLAAKLIRVILEVSVSVSEVVVVFKLAS